VECDQDEAPSLEPLALEQRRAVHPLQQPVEAVDHRVADELHPVAADPLGGEIVDRVL